jgi:hypothetical protein
VRDAQRAQARAPAAAASAAGYGTDHRLGPERTRRVVGPAPPASKEATAGVPAGGSYGDHRRRALSHRTRAADQDEVQTAQGGGMSKVRRWGCSESTEVTATVNPHASYVGLV